MIFRGKRICNLLANIGIRSEMRVQGLGFRVQINSLNPKPCSLLHVLQPAARASSIQLTSSVGLNGFGNATTMFSVC